MTTAPKPLPIAVCDVTREMAGEQWDHDKLAKAADLVLAHSVDTAAWTVLSNEVLYSIDKVNGCSCKSAEFQGRYCKHYIALRMAQRVEDMMGEKLMQNDTPIPAVTDDIEDPEVPEDIKHMFADEPQEPEAMADVTHSHRGFQYTDYPATLCIKRTIGHTELMCTFRDADENVAWGKAVEMIGRWEHLGEVYAAKHAPPAVTAPPAPGPAPAQPAMPGQAPLCPDHQAPMAPSNYGGFYCKRRTADGEFCKRKSA